MFQDIAKKETQLEETGLFICLVDRGYDWFLLHQSVWTLRIQRALGYYHHYLGWLLLLCSPLRKQAFTNIPKILSPKMKIFTLKSSDTFHISAQNKDCGYSLEPPRLVGIEEAGCIAFGWFVTRDVVVCLIFHLVSLVGYFLWLSLFLSFSIAQEFFKVYFDAVLKFQVNVWSALGQPYSLWFIKVKRKKIQAS